MEHIWRCRLCPDMVPAYQLLEHIRLLHPENYEETLRWPDGEPIAWEDADDFFF